MPITDISPDVDNYFVGAGVLKWQMISPVLDVGFRLAGNCSKFELSSQVTRLKHYSSQTGTRFKDRDVVTQVDATVALTLDEITASNLQLFLLGDKSGVNPIMVNILNTPNIHGALRLIGTNDVGAKCQIDLPSVLITPSGALGLINAGTWGEIVLTAEVNGDIATGKFGRLAWNISGEVAYP